MGIISGYVCISVVHFCFFRRDQATVSNPLSSTVSGDEEIGSVKKLDYVRLTPYGGKHPKYYILEIYYGKSQILSKVCYMKTLCMFHL